MDLAPSSNKIVSSSLEPPARARRLVSRFGSVRFGSPRASRGGFFPLSRGAREIHPPRGHPPPPRARRHERRRTRLRPWSHTARFPSSRSLSRASSPFVIAPSFIRPFPSCANQIIIPSRVARTVRARPTQPSRARRRLFPRAHRPVPARAHPSHSIHPSRARASRGKQTVSRRGLHSNAARRVTTRARSVDRSIGRSVETHLLCNSRNFAADPGGWPPTEASFDASRSAMAVARRRVASARRVADAIDRGVDRSVES